MQLNLQDIPRVETITKADFLKHYFKPQKPVVIERFIEDWPAYTKWSLDYMKEVAGDKTVPLYDDRPVDYKLTKCPNGEDLMGRGMGLSMRGSFTEENVGNIIESIRKVSSHYKK